MSELGRRRLTEPRRLAALIRDRIRTGEFLPGQRLPPEATLAVFYGTNRQNVHRAMVALVEEGWVTQHVGRGTFVRPLPPLQRIIGAKGVYRDDRGVYFSAGAKHWDLLAPTSIRYEPAPPEIAVLLGLGFGEEVLVRDRRMGPVGVDGPAEQLSASYLPASVARGTRLEEPDTGPTGIIGLLEASGRRLRFRRPDTGARRPREEEARWLGVERHTPLLVQWVTAVDEDDQPLLVTEYRWSSERYVLGGPEGEFLPRED